MYFCKLCGPAVMLPSLWPTATQIQMNCRKCSSLTFPFPCYVSQAVIPKLQKLYSSKNDHVIAVNTFFSVMLGRLLWSRCV